MTDQIIQAVEAQANENVPELHSGGDYPEPIVDHAQARDRALEAYRSIA